MSARFRGAVCWSPVVVLVAACCLPSLARGETGAEPETHQFDGKAYRITDAGGMVECFQAGERCAVTFTLERYMPTVEEITVAAEVRGLDPADVFDPGQVWCQGCGVSVPMAVLVRLMLPGAAVSSIGRSDVDQWTDGGCPHCHSHGFVMLTKDAVAPDEGWTAADQQRLVDYYRYLAGLWWSHQQGPRICDRCMQAVAHGEGYVKGHIREGRLYAQRLYCADCVRDFQTDEFLQNLQRDPDYSGAGLLQELRAWAGSSSLPAAEAQAEPAVKLAAAVVLVEGAQPPSAFYAEELIRFHYPNDVPFEGTLFRHRYDVAAPTEEDMKGLTMAILAMQASEFLDERYAIVHHTGTIEGKLFCLTAVRLLGPVADQP